MTKRKRTRPASPRAGFPDFLGTLDTLLEGYTVIGRDWRFRYLNDAAVRHARKPRELLLGRTVMECYPGIEATPLFEVVRRCMEEGKPERLDDELVHVDGSRVFFELRVQAQPDGVSILSIDVTALRHAEQALRLRERQLDMALRGGQLGIWHWDLASDRITTLQGAGPITGLAAGDNPGTGEAFKALVHPEDRGHVADRIARAIESRQGYEAEFRVIVPSTGAVLSVSARGQCLYDPEGRPLALTGVDIDTTDRQRTQAALRASQARLRSIIETAPECVKVLSPTGDLLEMNAAGLAMLEARTLAELQERPLIEFVLPEHRSAFKDLHQRVMLGGSGSLEFEVAGLLGTHRWLETRAVPLRGDEDEVQSLLGLTRDVTERRRTEEQLRSSEERFRQITDRIGEVFWMTDPVKNEVLYVSPAYERIWDRDRSSLCADPLEWLEAVHADDRPRMRAVWPRQADGNFDEEYRIVRPDGSVRWIHHRAYPLLDAAGEVYRLVGVAADVTAENEALESLRHSEEKFSKAFESSPDGLVMSRLRDGQIVEVNEAFVRLSGYSRDEVVGRTTLDLGLWVHPRDRERYLEALMARRSVRDEAAQFRSKAGEVLEAAVSGEIISLSDESVALTTIRDVTDRKRAERERATLEAQLRQSQKMDAVGRLAGGVAHDFNNMLGVILGYSDIALRQIDAGHPLFKSLNAIREAAERSAELTRQLLAFSRQQTIAPRVLDLNGQLSGMKSLLERIIGEDVSLEFTLAAQLWPVLMDPSQVDQAVANLAANARDAMPNGGTLGVETANVSVDDVYCRRLPGLRPGDYVTLTVTDSGDGMDEATRERAFEPFFTTKPEGKGTGLGLATIYGMVKQNDGFVGIYSEVGQGTAIRLYLPRSAQGPEVGTGKATTPALARGHETLLVVEDQEELREVARILLEELGYLVLEGTSPEDALELCERHPGEIHLLFTDVVMPTMNGKELAQRVKALRPAIRILFTSGYTADTIAHRGVLEPGIHFLEKPFTLDSLSRKVREVLTAPQETHPVPQGA
jgi:two-component system cell cycle sensor histidine kinase/response regulator CckA